MIPEVTTLDFESVGIGPRPNAYPPRPIGLAIRWPDGRTEYLCWESKHGDENCTKEEAHRALIMAYRGPVLFHNAAFDMEVAMQHFRLPYPRNWHDTLFLLFLHEPHAMTFSLKPSAARILNIAPEEQDLLRDWIVANVPGATKKNFGAYICEAPVSIVGPYAIGDVDRTWKLFERLYPAIIPLMEEPYNRERNLLPWLVDAEQRGVRMDRALLEEWQHGVLQLLTFSGNVVVERFRSAGVSIDVSTTLDSDADMADALEKAGLVPTWEYTPKGQRAVSKGALARTCLDKELAAALSFRNSAATLLRTSILPWIAQSSFDGRLHCSWLQVRGVDGDGTRTGRIGSADPNLANVMSVDRIPTWQGYTLPNPRSAFLPEEGEQWVCKDYSQQEPRITAHFENGPIMAAYNTNPDMDFYTTVQKFVRAITGREVTRGQCKVVTLATIYGAGKKKLAEQLGVSVEEGQMIKAAVFAALPGLRQLMNDVSTAVRTKGVLRTLGGRMVPLEPPMIIDGVRREFSYKMLNKLIQGSAADQTKQAIIDFNRAGSGGRLLTTVYDEINISSPGLRAVVALENAMVHGLPCDVPMRTSTEIGPSWGELK